VTRTNLLLYGLQRTGTNYLEVLVRRRYQVRFLNDQEDRTSPEHKHVRLYPEKDLVPGDQFRNQLDVPDFAAYERLLSTVPEHYLVISKDPYSWYLSYLRFAERCSWPTPDHHYIDEYNRYYESWLDLAEQTDRLHFVRYIDLLAEPESEIRRLGDRLGLRTRRTAGVASARVRRVPVSGKFTDDSASYYLMRRYLAEYDDATLEEVNRHLDTEVVERLGYSIEKTARSGAEG
jgi:hypothetical protein